MITLTQLTLRPNQEHEESTLILPKTTLENATIISRVAYSDEFSRTKGKLGASKIKKRALGSHTIIEHTVTSIKRDKDGENGGTKKYKYTAKYAVKESVEEINAMLTGTGKVLKFPKKKVSEKKAA